MPYTPQYTLKPVQFAPTVFNPAAYTAQTPDLSILERSLAQREARMTNAAQQKSAVDQALGVVEQKLNPAETEWFNNYKRNIDDQIQNSINIGDYGKALRTATSLAGETAKDTAILSRVKANEDYTKWTDTLQKRLDKNEISQDAMKWALASNPYQFTETTDINGNVVGGKLADRKQVYDTLNWKDVVAQAAAFNRPDVTSTESSGGGTNPALYNTNNENLAGLNGKLGVASSSWKSGHQIEQVTSEEILNTIGGLLNLPDLKNQLLQDYDVSVWNYQQKLANGELSDSERKNMMEQGLIKNGSPVSIKEYLNDKVKTLANALGYKKETTVSGSESGFGFTNKAGTDIEGYGGGEQGYGANPKTVEKGPQVEQSVPKLIWSVGKTVTQITQNFKIPE